jgi:hypothetical protein
MYRGMNVASTSDDLANIISKSSLDELSYDWKANTIRVMVGGEKYYPDGLLRTDYDAVLQTELIRIDELVSWCTLNGLKINLGLAGLSDGLFTSQAAQTRLINAWKLIAERYKNTSTVWAYDLANEPVVNKQYPYDYTYPLDNTIMMWPTLAETLVNEIRVIDSVKSIIIESLNYGINLDDIKPIDASVPNIIYSVHLYQPGQLTGQFGPAIPVINYPGTIDGIYYDKAKLKELLAPLKVYQEKYRVPIYIGEFSCVRWAPSNSAYNYIRDCIEIFEEYNWDYDYYSFRTWNGWSVEHSSGYYDNVFPTTKTDRELLLRSYFQQNLAQVQFLANENLPSICYPNPVKDEICIATDHLDFSTASVAIFDVLGKLKTRKTVLNKEVIKIDTSNLSQGVYLYSIKNEIGKTILNGKFIKK